MQIPLLKSIVRASHAGVEAKPFCYQILQFSNQCSQHQSEQWAVNGILPQVGSATSPSGSLITIDNTYIN